MAVLTVPFALEGNRPKVLEAGMEDRTGSGAFVGDVPASVIPNFMSLVKLS